MLTPQVLSDLIASLYECTIYMFAAQIFLCEKIANIKKLLPKIFVFGVLSGMLSTVTFQTLFPENLNQFRIIINIILFTCLIRIIFKESWWDTVKLSIFNALFGILTQIISQALILNVLNLTIAQVMNDHLFVLFTMVLPFDLLSIVFALCLRKLRPIIISIFAQVKLYKKTSYITSIAVAILLQLTLLTSIWIDYVDNYKLAGNTLHFIVFMSIILSIVILSLFILHRTIRVTEEKIVEASGNAMSENLYSLLNSVRGQRHDFINHVQIIKSLFHTEDKEGLCTYLDDLTDDITVLNNILKVDNPFVGALLNSKITQAGLKGIDLQVDIDAKLATLSSKAFDLTRILGNLINNAIEDLEQNHRDEKWIRVIIQEHGPFLSVAVTNPGSPPVEIVEKLMEPGYTTKGGEHGGLGLHICKQLSKKLHGKLECNVIAGIETSFSLMIPK